ncbi:MAG: alpha-galactosidase [Vicinamibacterales bacterium]
MLAAGLLAAPVASGAAELARAGDAFVVQEGGQRVWVVGSNAVSFRLGLNGSGALNTMGLDRTGSGKQWKPGTAADFTFLAGTRRLTPGQATFTFREARASATATEVRLELVFEDTTSKLRVTRHYACAAGSGAIEVWSVFETLSNAAKVSISDIGVWRLALPVDAVNWVTGLQAGEEQGGRFTRRRQGLAAGGQFQLASAARSSETAVPVVWFSGAPGSFFGGLNWSGAWKLQATGPAASGLVTIQVTLGDTATTVVRGRPLEGPHGFFGVTRSDQSDVTLALQSYFRNGIRHGRPFEAPITYNTWFAYGTRIDDEAIRDEMGHAARAGVELFMIDAGWYAGALDVWDFSTGLGNWIPDPERFPSGLGALSDEAHALGMKLGVWVEPERMDLATVYELKLAKERILATVGGRYHPERDNGAATAAQICLGDAEAREWVLNQLVQLVDSARPDYLKWDNNYWINCDRADHDHGAKGGNFAHVKGLYAVLSALRERYPGLSIENCASGGNRLDPGLLQFTDSAWMDDVTAPSSHVRHNLEGLGTIFPPAYLLSFVTGNESDPGGAGSGSRALEFRSRMSGMLGLTWRSGERGDEELEEAAAEIARAKAIRGAVPGAAAFMLTDQARADGLGGVDAVQHYSPSAGTSAVFVYAGNGVDWFTVRLQGLEAGTRYLISTVWGEELAEATGAELMTTGVDIINTSESGAHVVLVTPRAADAAAAVASRR